MENRKKKLNSWKSKLKGNRTCRTLKQQIRGFWIQGGVHKSKKRREYRERERERETLE